MAWHQDPDADVHLSPDPRTWPVHPAEPGNLCSLLGPQLQHPLQPLPPPNTASLDPSPPTQNKSCPVEVLRAEMEGLGSRKHLGVFPCRSGEAFLATPPATWPGEGGGTRKSGPLKMPGMGSRGYCAVPDTGSIQGEEWWPVSSPGRARGVRGWGCGITAQ